MSKPTNYLVRMLVFLLLVYGTGALLAPQLARFFLANPLINSVIIVVELFGVAWNLRQVLRLYPESRWVEHFRRTRQPLQQAVPPVLLAPMARMLQSRAEGERRITLSGTARGHPTFFDTSRKCCSAKGRPLGVMSGWNR